MPLPAANGASSSAPGRSASGRASSSTTARCRRPGRSTRPAYDSIMINSNPETVSTDFDASDRLYFEPLDAESVARGARARGDGRRQRMPPVIVQFGGQTAINLAEPLTERGVTILGSSQDTIDLAEDRERFEAFLRGLGIPQPPGAAVTHAGRCDATSPSGSAIRCWCGRPTCSAAGRWRSSTTTTTSPATSATRPA